MKKLDFRNFSVPTGITRQTREVFDAREQIADLLYTRVSGIKADSGWINLNSRSEEPRLNSSH